MITAKRTASAMKSRIVRSFKVVPLKVSRMHLFWLQLFNIRNGSFTGNGSQLG
jgi:hypothetical protein